MLGSHLKVGLLFETQDLGSCQTTTRVSVLAQKPSDDSCCWESISLQRTPTRLSRGNQSKLLVSPKTGASSITLPELSDEPFDVLGSGHVHGHGGLLA